VRGAGLSTVHGNHRALTAAVRQYEEERKNKDYGYERDLERELMRYTSECTRRINVGLKRVEENERQENEADQSLVSSHTRRRPKWVS
jgi:hypothetical protein